MKKLIKQQIINLNQDELTLTGNQAHIQQPMVAEQINRIIKSKDLTEEQKQR